VPGTPLAFDPACYNQLECSTPPPCPRTAPTLPKGKSYFFRQPRETFVTVSNRYHGKICAKHPGLDGLRHSTKFECVQCRRDAERYRKSRKDAAKRDARLLWGQDYFYRAGVLTDSKAKEKATARRYDRAPGRVEARRARVRARGDFRDRRDYIAAYKKANPHKVNACLAKRRAAKLQRTPAWADHDRIANTYRLAADFGLEVDHIVPLQGKLVSGLHTHHNLQLLTPTENVRKHAKFDPWTHVHELPTPQPA
jgi:hypothetical protein